jgi:hypothetical protein
MQRTFTTGRVLRAIGVTFALSWICALVFIQWTLLMTPAALRFESATSIRVVDLSHWVRGHVGKPLSPPSQ